MKPIQQWTKAEIIDFVKNVDKKTWIKIGIGVFICVTLIYFVIWPAWVTRMDVRGQIKTLEGQISTVETLGRKKPELLKNKHDYQELIQGAKERLYMSGEASFLLGAISKLAKESNVSIVASRPKDFLGKFPDPFNDQYEANVYDFAVEGKYHNLGNFVSRIESNPKLLRIQYFRLQPNEKSVEAHMADISLSAVSFKKGKT